MANQAAVKAQFERLDDVTILTPVTEVLGALGPELRQHRKAYVSLAAQIHPDRGGNFDKERGTACMKVVSRAMEQARAVAEYESRASLPIGACCQSGLDGKGPWRYHRPLQVVPSESG